MSNGVVLSVSQLNRYVKSIIEQDMNLQTVFVEGEISNFTNHYKTGHYYMTIKDESSSIKAVMFRTANMRLKFMPENSMKVIIRGRVSVFERDGQYQLYIDDMQPDGTGALSLAFEQLKAKLAKEGLRPDVISVDPPRKGLAEDVVTAMAAMKPERIVYVSCDPATLGRDIRRFAERGYRVQRVSAVDLFPGTQHVETVALLVKE